MYTQKKILILNNFLSGREFIRVTIARKPDVK